LEKATNGLTLYKAVLCSDFGQSERRNIHASTEAGNDGHRAAERKPNQILVPASLA
jgi:hypothetical protein